MKKIMFASLFMLLMTYPAFAADEGKQVSREGFTFLLPVKWEVPKDEQPRGRRDAREKIVMLTKDGASLNRIELRKRLITAEFGHTRKRLAKGMMPQEMAEVVLSDLELNDALKNFKVIENRPATVSGIPGFRLVLSFRNNGLLQYQCVYYGFQKDELFYSIFYTAPQRHYFETNRETFERVVKSLMVEGGAGGAGAWTPGVAN